MFEKAVEDLKAKFGELANTYKQVRAEKVAQMSSATPAKQITGSVGQGGDNHKADVLLVQQLLNKKGAKLVEDGVIGKGTITAIVLFQRAVFPGWQGDGLISPGKDTWKKLSGGSTSTDTTPKDDTNKDGTKDEGTTPKASFYTHAKADQVKLTFGENAKPLNADASLLLRSLLAGSGNFSATITSTLRTYHDQARIILTQVVESNIPGWYGQDTYAKYKQVKAKKPLDIQGFADFLQERDKKRSKPISNHIPGYAIDVAGAPKMSDFKALATKQMGNGVRAILDERTTQGCIHIEFSFKVTNLSSGGGGGGGSKDETDPKTPTNTVDTALVADLTAALQGKGDIKAQVKEGNTNARDIMVVKALLTKAGYYNFSFKAETLATEMATLGKAGADLTAAIKKFQLEKMGHSSPDGIIDVGGGTIKGLNGQLPQIQLTGAWTADKFGNEIFVEGATNNIIVSIPKGATGSMHAVILFGGTPSSSYGAHYMKAQVEAAAADMFGKAIVVTSKFENKLQLATYNAILKSKGVSIGTYSVAGFSAGGPAAFEAAGGAKALGLIDPAMNAGHVKNYGNAKMIYNPVNWSDPKYVNLVAAMKKLATLMGANAIDTKGGYDHLAIPKMFLSKFKSHLL